MTEAEANRNFIRHMEETRNDMGLSVRNFARLMRMSEHGYYKIISGQRQSVSMGLILAMYELTGRYMFEYIGCKPPAEYVAYGKYRLLKKRDQEVMDKLLDALLAADDKERTEDARKRHRASDSVKQMEKRE